MPSRVRHLLGDRPSLQRATRSPSPLRHESRRWRSAQRGTRLPRRTMRRTDSRQTLQRRTRAGVTGVGPPSRHRAAEIVAFARNRGFGASPRSSWLRPAEPREIQRSGRRSPRGLRGIRRQAVPRPACSTRGRRGPRHTAAPAHWQTPSPKRATGAITHHEQRHGTTIAHARRTGESPPVAASGPPCAHQAPSGRLARVGSGPAHQVAGPAPTQAPRISRLATRLPTAAVPASAAVP